MVVFMPALRLCFRAFRPCVSLLFLASWLYPQGLAGAEGQSGAGQGQFADPEEPILDGPAVPPPVNMSAAGHEARAELVADPAAPQDKEKEAKAGNGNAAAAGSGYRLSMEEAIELAIQRNLNLLESRLADRTSDIGVREAWAQYYPTFTPTLAHSNSFSTGSPTGDGLTTLGGGVAQQLPWGTQLNFALSDTASQTTGKNAGSATFSADQPLWKGAGTDVGLAAIRTARINRLISRGSLEAATQQLIYSVRSAYYNVIMDLQNCEVDNQAISSAQLFLDMTGARLKAGQITPLDVSNAQLQLSSRKGQLASDQSVLGTALFDLKRLLDVDLNEKIQVDVESLDFGEKVEPGLSKVIVPEEATGTVYLKVTKDDKPVGEPKVLYQAVHFDESVVLREALNSRIDLLNARRAVALQKVQALLNQNGLGHQIDLVGSFGRTTTGRSVLEADNGKEANAWSAGVNATFPWGKIKDRAAYERALLALDKAETDLKIARTAVEYDVRNTLGSLRAREVSVLIGGETVEQAKLTAVATRMSFDRALKDSFAVRQAEDALVQAKRDFISSKISYLVLLAQLELYVAKPTGRVDLGGLSVGGLVESKLPDTLKNRGLPKLAPEAEPQPADDPFGKAREYRQDYKAGR